MKTQAILDALKKTKRPTYFLLNVFMGGFDYRGMKRKAFYPTLPDFSISSSKKYALALKNKKHNFHSVLYQLKKQGLIEKERDKNGVYWKITSRGKNRIEKLKNVLHFPKPIYKKEGDKGINIVVFDIPEKRKNARNWIRSALLSMGFTVLQKSVWISENKLPKEFLKDLSNLNLMNCVHIFRVIKSGTIKNNSNSDN